jgi:hypothetical protein
MPLFKRFSQRPYQRGPPRVDSSQKLENPMNQLNYLVPVLFLFGCGASEAAHTKGPIPEDRILETHVETHPSQGQKRIIDGGKASIRIGGNRVTASLTTRDLTPGHVHTLWLVAVNNPMACSSEPCKSSDVLGNSEAVGSDVRWADGQIVPASGEVTFRGEVPVGAWQGSWFGTGLNSPQEAEYHLVVNDHGTPLPGREEAMLTSYREGCTDESLPPPFPATAKADGVAGPNKCALVQDAIFVQSR